MIQWAYKYLFFNKKKKKNQKQVSAGENFGIRNVKSGKLRIIVLTLKVKTKFEREMENNAMKILEEIKSSDVSFSLFPAFD